jgi:hypothetical protein
MNSFKRFLFGILSSALFAVGLARAGDAMDPVSRGLTATNSTIQKSAPDSGTATWIDANGN